MAINARAGRLGEIGEEIAAQFLIKKGYRILDRNWRIKEGEIDIVALSPESDIIFIEVKSRTSAAFGDPLESIKVALIAIRASGTRPMIPRAIGVRSAPDILTIPTPPRPIGVATAAIMPSLSAIARFSHATFSRQPSCLQSSA